MQDPLEILYRAAKRARSSIQNNDPQVPRCLVYSDGSIHQFNHAFLNPDESQTSALMMKAVCQLLHPDYVVSIATVTLSIGPQDGQISLSDEVGMHEALLVILNMPDGGVYTYLGKVLRDAEGVLCGFSEVRGMDAQMLTEQVPNPFRIPVAGLPEWLTDRVAALLGESEAAALQDIRSSSPRAEQPLIH